MALLERITLNGAIFRVGSRGGTRTDMSYGIENGTTSSFCPPVMVREWHGMVHGPRTGPGITGMHR